MPGKRGAAVDYRVVELDGVRYAILREAAFRRLCRKAGVTPESEPRHREDLALDRATLAEKLVRRRQIAGLSQAELARRAGIRPETLNRIERGHTTPDFATIRRLVVALNQAEQSPP